MQGVMVGGQMLSGSRAGHFEIRGSHAGWPFIVIFNMFSDRRIERHQLPCFLKVYNRFTDKPLGFLGSVTDDRVMLISQLPLLVGANFELRFKLPGQGAGMQCIDLSARCLWSHEDVTPHYYDSGFILLKPPAEYAGLINALRQYFSFYPLPASA